MSHTFADLDLLPSLQATLTERELTVPTEVQRRTLPALLQGRSVVGVAQTGSGKTLAYVLPVLDRLKRLEDEGSSVAHAGRPRAVVVVPSRDLGEQVTRVFKLFTHTTRLRVRSMLGGTKREVSRSNVSGEFEVLVATPGRLTQALDDSLLYLADVRVLVFDEADQMLDAGFLPAAKRIAGACPPARQMALFSATVPPQVQELITQLFADAELIRGGEAHRVVKTLVTSNRLAPDGKRGPLLDRVLAESVAGGTLFFTNTREQCDALGEELRARGLTCAVYRGEMDKQERRTNLQAFRDGEVRFLISTDLASRGLDIDHVDRVVNYHLPQKLENYLHRVGRTARAGRAGLVVNFVTERDRRLMEQLGNVVPPPRAKYAQPAPKASAARQSTDAPPASKARPAPAKGADAKGRDAERTGAAPKGRDAQRTGAAPRGRTSPATRADARGASKAGPKATRTPTSERTGKPRSGARAPSRAPSGGGKPSRRR